MKFNNPTEYFTLYAIISHLGNDIQSGHCIAYCKNRKDDAWYQYNDENISKIEESTIFQKEAIDSYLLFYKKEVSFEENIKK